jgi:hypothetical protein
LAVYWQIIRINEKTGNDLKISAPTASQWSVVGQIDQLPPRRPYCSLRVVVHGASGAGRR